MMRVRGFNLSRRLTPERAQPLWYLLPLRDGSTDGRGEWRPRAQKWSLLYTVHVEDEEGSKIYYPDGEGAWRSAPSQGWEEGITYNFEPREPLYCEERGEDNLVFYVKDSQYREVFTETAKNDFTPEHNGVLTMKHFVRPNRPIGKAIYIYQPDGDILQYRATCPWVEIPPDEQMGCLTAAPAKKGEILRGLRTLEAEVVVYGESLKDDAKILNIAREAGGSLPCLHAFYLWWATTPGSLAGDLLYSSAPAEISSVLMALSGDGDSVGLDNLRKVLNEEAKRLLKKEFNLNIED